MARHPRRLARVLGASLVAGFVGVAASPAPSSAAPVAPSTVVQFAPRPALYASDVQTFVNAHRRSAGAAPVALQWQLNQAAQRQAVDMARRRVLSHYGSDGSSAGTRISRTGYRWSMWGENVAAGQTTASQVVWAWLSSSGHRAVLLNRGFTQMGLGRAVASNGVAYWSLVMARPG